MGQVTNLASRNSLVTCNEGWSVEYTYKKKVILYISNII